MIKKRSRITETLDESFITGGVILMSDISKYSNKESSQLDKIVDGLTGIVNTEKIDYALSANRIIKGIFSKSFLESLKIEWNQFVQKGQIKSNYEDTKSYISSLTELISYLDNDIPNDDVLDTLRRLFFMPALIKDDDSHDLMAIEYIRIVKSLNSSELIVLFTTFDLVKNFAGVDVIPVDQWRKNLSNFTGMMHIELIEVHEKKLVELNLLNKCIYQDKSGVNVEPYYRLTNLGYSLCDYVKAYEQYKE